MKQKVSNAVSCLVLATILFLLATTTANAAKTIRTGIYNFKPLVYSADNGAPAGLFVEILDQIARKEGWDIVYRHGTWQEGLDRLKGDQIDLLVCIGYTPEREEFLDFPREYLLLDWGLVYTAKETKINTIMDLEGKTVTALKGSIYTAGFKDLLRQFSIRANVVEVDQAEQIFASVKNGTADAGVTASITGMLNKTAQSIERTPIVFTPVQIGYAVNGGKNQDLLAALDRHITAMKADKTSVYHSALEKIFNKAPQKPPTYLYISIAAVIGLLLVSLIFIATLRHQIRTRTKALEENKKELQHSKDLLLNIINTSTDFIFAKDRQLRTILCNTAFAAALGKTPQELQNKTDIENGWNLELVKGNPEKGITGYEHDDLQALSGETVHINDQANVNGSIRYFDTIKAPLKDAEGEIFGLLGISHDITDSRQTQLALQKHLVALTCPLDNPEELSFSDLFNLDDLQELQDRFAEATGVASLITMPDGTPITRPSNFCRLCSEIIRSTEKGLANCRKSDATIGRHHPEGPIIQPCLSGGLWDAGASITLGGKHFANWLIGQVRNEAQHENDMLRYADHIGADREQFRAALAEVPVMSRKQFEKISLALQTLANELSLKAYQNIQQSRFIAERRTFEAELQAKNSELESFTYTASHDLKSPLITIHSYANLIIQDLQSGNYSRATQDLERISNTAVKMAHLLDDLLQLSRVGKQVNPHDRLDLKRLLDGVLTHLAGPLAEKKIRITVQPDLPTVYGDKMRLEELLQNLLENAIKYMGEQPAPHIEVGCRKTGTGQVLFVRDNGIGIAAQHHETVFGLFSRLDATIPGSGVGLALARKIIETHGGKLWVESDGPGTGSCFCFTLPSQNDRLHTNTSER